MDNYQKFIHLSRYARYVPEENRRETWEETVDRYISFFKARFPDSTLPWEELQKAVLDLDVMPSMRALMTAGPALERDNTAGYNCSYVAVDDPIVFSEIMHILMCGTGVGFSVEDQYTEKLPVVPDFIDASPGPIVVEDSKEGWALAFRRLIEGLYAGESKPVDYSKIRPAGERLKTFGGRASGPTPLRNLFEFTVKKFQGAQGRKLTSSEIHDIVCKIGDVVVCGGVRRSALISLSDIHDTEMREAKIGEWWKDNPQRALANNSAVYPADIDKKTFEKEWQSLVESQSGERGIFSREACKLPERRERTDFGTNPCAEIVLRNKQFCNLTEVIVRPEDGPADLVRKVELATTLGTLQSSLDHFPFLSEEWVKNTKEERLLGVSLTGVKDNKLTSEKSGRLKALLEDLREVSVQVNKSLAAQLGLNQSAAITCVKPSGTVSQLCNTASGLHPRYAPHYIRRVRLDNKDPLGQWMIDAGIPCEKDFYGDSNWVFSFPVRAPDSVYRNEETAIKQLEFWKLYQESWCEHKPSVTVYVAEDEWDEVGEWVWQNLSSVSGVSFLPKEDGSHSYVQAPYEEITYEEWKRFSDKMPVVDFSTYTELEDNTISSQELACKGGACEIV